MYSEDLDMTEEEYMDLWFEIESDSARNLKVEEEMEE